MDYQALRRKLRLGDISIIQSSGGCAVRIAIWSVYVHKPRRPCFSSSPPSVAWPPRPSKPDQPPFQLLWGKTPATSQGWTPWPLTQRTPRLDLGQQRRLTREKTVVQATSRFSPSLSFLPCPLTTSQVAHRAPTPPNTPSSSTNPPTPHRTTMTLKDKLHKLEHGLLDSKDEHAEENKQAEREREMAAEAKLQQLQSEPLQRLPPYNIPIITLSHEQKSH